MSCEAVAANECPPTELVVATAAVGVGAATVVATAAVVVV